MECLKRFNKRMSRCGGTLRNEKIYNSKMLLQETFHDDASLSKGIYFWELGKNQKKDYENDSPIAIRLYKRTYSAANGYTVKFQTEYNTAVLVGDVIFDTVHNEFYICTESFDMDTIHYQGKLTLCNWILKWQNNSGKILEYPCYDINATQYNSGETAKGKYTIGTAQHMLKLPCDENTLVLDSPRRFFLDKNKLNPTAYIVTQNDNTSYNIGKGIVVLTVAQYARDDKKDNLELGICDYIDVNNQDTSINKPITRSVINYETTIIKSGGDSQLFIGKFYDENGKEITDIVPKWTIICDFLNKLEVKESGNEIWISIDDEEYIDEEIKLVFSDEFSNYSSTIIIKIDSLL